MDHQEYLEWYKKRALEYVSNDKNASEIIPFVRSRDARKICNSLKLFSSIETVQGIYLRGVVKANYYSIYVFLRETNRPKTKDKLLDVEDKISKLHLDSLLQFNYLPAPDAYKYASGENAIRMIFNRSDK